MARAAGRRSADPAPSLEQRASHLRGLISELSLAAAAFLPRSKVEETARHWLAGGRLGQEDERAGAAVTDAMVLALDVGLFTPSASGVTAIDRFARQHPPAGADERVALDLLRRAVFRVLRVEAAHPDGGWSLTDLATAQRLRLIDDDFPGGCEGMAIAARIAVLADDAVVTAGPVTPLDEAALDIARARMRPGGGGLTNPNRCAEAIFRHVVRHGVPEIPGLNRPPEGHAQGFLFGPEDGPVHAIAFAWAEAEGGADPPAAEVRMLRELLGAQELLEALTGCVLARAVEAAGLALAYEQVLTIQVETIERRAATGVGIGLASLEVLAAQIEEAVRTGLAPPGVDQVLAEARRRVRLAGPDRAARPADADLDRVLARIQALRAKTVDRGCTEAEAMIAAGKVAELLDRYGLSLGEVELKEQSCEGFGVGTGRRRFGPIDACIPTVGAFCGCRVWSEQAADGEIRYVFFGLPADVAGARYLYDLVERAFATETERFKRSELYAGHRAGERRGASHSFQTGLAQGIARKLDALHREREAGMKAQTGRDLVLAKEAVIDEELAKLGLHFHRRGRGRGRYVLREAFAAGQEAGARFEHRPGIGGR